MSISVGNKYEAYRVHIINENGQIFEINLEGKTYKQVYSKIRSVMSNHSLDANEAIYDIIDYTENGENYRWAYDLSYSELLAFLNPKGSI